MLWQLVSILTVTLTVDVVLSLAMWRLSCRENLFSEIPKVCFKETQPAGPEITLENFVGYDSAKYKFDCARTSIFTIPTKLKLYNTCILPIFLYGFECWAVTKRDVLKIDALDQWCLQKLLGIKWYHHVRNNEVRLSLIHIWRCRRSTLCRSRWSPYH